jgi:hypothetical protein
MTDPARITPGFWSRTGGGPGPGSGRSRCARAVLADFQLAEPSESGWSRFVPEPGPCRNLRIAGKMCAPLAALVRRLRPGGPGIWIPSVPTASPKYDAEGSFGRSPCARTRREPPVGSTCRARGVASRGVESRIDRRMKPGKRTCAFLVAVLLVLPGGFWRPSSPSATVRVIVTEPDGTERTWSTPPAALPPATGGSAKARKGFRRPEGARR